MRHNTLINRIWKNKITGNIFILNSRHESGWCQGDTLHETEEELQTKRGDRVHIHEDFVNSVCERIF